MTDFNYIDLSFIMRVLFSLIFLSLCYSFAYCDVISPENALSNVKSHYNFLQKETRGIATEKLTLTLKDSYGQPAVYVFSSDVAGFIIASADDSILPLLGYSETGNFVADNLPPAMSAWLDDYVAQIQSQRKITTNLGSNLSTRSDWAPVGPLVKTRWDQENPYNEDCWLIMGDSKIQCPTGCVATAMAQVMNYFQYPEVGQGSIAYQPYGNAQGYSINFAEQPFDWANMLDSYEEGDYTPEEASAVAYLMKACGYSVRMLYSQTGSGADDFEILNALYTYFKYSPQSQFAIRSFYSDDEWKELLYTHLSTVGPAVYNGRASFGGHSFVCDGYDGEGYFHFNWGWSGLGDGYFLLGSLNPGVQGVGGFAGGYNLDQSMILPVPESEFSQPAEILQYGSLEGSIKDDILSISLMNTEGDSGWSYSGIPPYRFDFYLLLEEDGNNIRILKTDLNNISLPLGQVLNYGTIDVNLKDLDLTEGKSYKLTLGSTRAEENEKDFIPVRPLNGMYNYLTVKNNGESFEIINNEVEDIQILSLEPAHYLVYNEPSSFNVTIYNPGEFQLTRIVRIGFINSKGTFCYTSDASEITVNPGEKVQLTLNSEEWTRINRYPEVKSAGEFTAKLIQETTNKFYPMEEYPSVYIFPFGTEIERTVIPEPGQLPEGEILSEITVGWGYALNLTKPENITVEIDGEEIPEIEITTKDGVGIAGENINNGYLAINIPPAYQLKDASYKINVPKETFSLSIDGLDVPNIGFSLDYITGEITLVPELTEETGNCLRVFDLNGVKVLETTNPMLLNTFKKGIYVINGKTVFLP